MIAMLPFRHVIVADFEFEFGGNPGNRPRPVGLVAKDLHTGQSWRIFRGEFDSAPPFPIGRDALFTAYYASAELGCFKALNWPMPVNILDLFVEFRNRANGLSPPAGFGLIGALSYFGLDSIGATEKEDMRSLVLAGGPWSGDDRAAILEYCAGDVFALERPLLAMQPRIDLRRALLRGRYMRAAAAMEWNGVAPRRGHDDSLCARTLDLIQVKLATVRKIGRRPLRLGWELMSALGH